MGSLVVWIVLSFLGMVVFEIDSNYTAQQFLLDVHRREPFQHVLILKNANASFDDSFGTHFLKDFSEAVNIPFLVFSESTSFFLSSKFNSKVLTVVYLEEDSGESILERMVEMLREITSSKVVFLLKNKNKPALRELFHFCWMNSVINVLAIYQDFSTSPAFYRYSQVPPFAIEQLPATDGGPPTGGYYPNRISNLYGFPIRVAFGVSEPKIIFFKTKENRTHIGGYIGHLFQVLARKHNITLVPTISTEASARELLAFVQNGTVDIAAVHTWITFSQVGFTYPYDFINWCLMLPIEPSVPGYELFMKVFRWETLLITIGFIALLSALLEYTKRISGVDTNLISYIINDNCLRGVMGQSFSEIRSAPLRIRYIYLLICLLGMVLSASYNSHLQTFVTSPPSVAKIRHYDDLLASGRKIYILKEEFEGLGNAFDRRHLPMFVVEERFAKYLAVRDSLNTTYAYIVNNIKWTIVQEQQKIFTRPLFRKPEEMCVFSIIPMAFPINGNSILKGILNKLILQTRSSGLMEFWHRRSFIELIDAGKLNLMDLSSRPGFVPMKVEDLQMIVMLLAMGLFLAMLCFLMEICVHRWRCRAR